MSLVEKIMGRLGIFWTISKMSSLLKMNVIFPQHKLEIQVDIGSLLSTQYGMFIQSWMDWNTEMGDGRVLILL